MTDTDTWTVTCNYCGTSFDTARPRPFCSVHCRDRAAWYGPTVPAHRNYAARRAVHADRRASTNPTHTTPEGDAA